MKDISVSSSIDEKKQPRKKISLLKKFDIPVDHLDFGFVGTCNDAREIERILRVLRSGEEGHYPELVVFVEDRLKLLDPNSRVLRVEVPVLRSEYLDKAEREDIQNDLSEWIGSFENNQCDDSTTSRRIFTETGDGDGEVPIRGHDIFEAETKTSSAKDDFVKKPNPNRIKSWEYAKWDKLDVEAELTKLDVTDMQINEWEKFQKPKLQEEQKKVEKFMKNVEDKPSKAIATKHPLPKLPSTLLPQKARMSPEKASFIEELPTDWDVRDVKDKGSTSNSIVEEVKPIRPKRRIRIQIDDINMGY